MNKYFFYFLFIAFNFISCNQSDENILEVKSYTFTSQSELDNFQNSDNSIEVNVVISGKDFYSLKPLSSIKFIQNLTIENSPKLINLDGLENLRSISGNLNITNNRSLGNLDAIKNISVKGDFTILNNLHNPKKENLSTNSHLKEKVYDGDVFISNERDFNEFIKHKYTVIKGDFKIHGLTSTSFNFKTDIKGLESIVKVEGFSFEIESTKIKNLEGLENLKEVENLRILKNEELNSLEGIENLQTIHQGLSISYTSNLKDLKGLKNLKSFGSFYAYKNSSLVSLQEMKNLNQFEVSSIIIKENQVLENLEGLENITRITNTLEIHDNKSLKNFIGLDKLSNIRYFNIDNNESLINFEGLHNCVLGEVYIRNNKSLETFSDNFSKGNQLSRLIVSNNASLINLKGLESIDNIITLTINDNNSLISLAGFDKVYKIWSNFVVNNNKSLVDYCPINPNFKIYNQFSSSYNVKGNAYNPTISQITSDNNCKN